MGDPSPPCEALSLLSLAFRRRSTGTLWLGSGVDALQVVVRKGEVVAVRPGPGILAPPQPIPEPDGSVRLKLQRVLTQVGLGVSGLRRSPAVSARDLRERVVEHLARDGEARLEEADTVLDDRDRSVGPTEPLLLEALGRLPKGAVTRRLLGGLDRSLVLPPDRQEDRSLTVTEACVVSRVDGVAPARDVLARVPVDDAESERALAGLLLTGRLAWGTRTPPSEPPDPAPSPPPRKPEPPHTADPADQPVAQPAAQPVATPAATAEPVDAGRARRQEVLELFQRLPTLNHFEVLGLEPGSSAADVKRAHTALTKRYHPDGQSGDGLAEVHDAAEAILIRVGEAWHALSDTGSRAAYERRLRGNPGPRRRAEPVTAEPALVDELPATGGALLSEAEHLLGTARYWDAIQLLEAAMPRIRVRWQQHRARILLARAYAGNPKWVHRAEEILQELVRDAPRSAEAHYELGRLYKAGGLTARARSMFRKALELKPQHRHAAAELGLAARPGFFRRLFGTGRNRA